MAGRLAASLLKLLTVWLAIESSNVADRCGGGLDDSRSVPDVLRTGVVELDDELDALLGVRSCLVVVPRRAAEERSEAR